MRWVLAASLFFAGTLFAAPPSLPPALPFSVVRAEKGTPLSPEERDAFTLRYGKLLRKRGVFRYLLHIVHGADPSTGFPPFAIFWDGVNIVKKGKRVTFVHFGGGHNVMIKSSKVLSQAASFYTVTHNPLLAELALRLSQGVKATMQGMVFSKEDPEKLIMARNIIFRNYCAENQITLCVDYLAIRTPDDHWNAHRIHIPHNPTWGDIWATNTRSKDDLPHIFRAAAFLSQLPSLAADPKLAAAAQELLTDLQGFAQDIVDHGYHIRTKDKNGRPYVPNQDLASFVDYERFDPQAECNGKLTLALLATGKTLGNECGEGIGGLYEKIATKVHYFNYDIIWGFHMDAVLYALLHRQNAVAQKLLVGLGHRMDALHKSRKRITRRRAGFPRDFARLLVQAAGVGLPLTWEEARIIEEELYRSIAAYEKFPLLDLFDPGFPDGIYRESQLNPPGAISLEELLFPLEYCGSPLKNPKSAPFINCELLVKTLAADFYFLEGFSQSKRSGPSQFS